MSWIDWPGEKLLIRLWETAEKSGIGFARPWLIRREGKARASVEYLNKVALAQADADVLEVQSGRLRYDRQTASLVPTAKTLSMRW